MLTACSEPSVEDQFFGKLEERVAELERLTEQDTVCMSHAMEISANDEEEFMALAEQMEAKHGNDLPEEYESRMGDIMVRMESSMMELMPKMDPDC